MSSETEEQVETLSQSNDDEHELGACSSSSSFLEYHVPLADSNRSLDEHVVTIGESDEGGVDNAGDNDDDHNQKERPQRGSQHPSHDESVRASRRMISGQSVGFKSSVEHSSVNDHNHTIKLEDRYQNTPPRHNRSMDIGMDGHITQVKHSDDSKNSNANHPVSGNVNPTPSIINAAESTTAPLPWVDSDKGIDDEFKYDDGDHHYGNQGITGLAGDFSFNTSTSVFPATFRPSSISSSEGNSRMRASSYSISDTRGRDDGIILEENAAVNVSFDESEASNTTGTGLTSRVKDVFSLHRISILIVKWIPYVFLCCFGNKIELRASALNDRIILARLNILSFFFSTIQLAASLWLIVVVYVEGLLNPDGDEYRHEFYLWNNNGCIVAIGCLAFVLVFTCFWTTRIVKEVDLVGALRFLWLLLWILPVATFLNITALDYHKVTRAWIRHNWDSKQLWWFRSQLCLPETDETLCMVPIRGGLDYDSENEWCFMEYNSTECTEIRDEAQEETAFILSTFYRSLASWGLVYVFIMILIIKSLERIISKPMVQKSREVNVVGWLTFPVFCTALFGSIILFSPYTYLDKLVQPRWLGYLYLIAAGLFFLALLMGWFLSAASIRSNIDKQNKSNAALMLVIVLFINAFVLLTILVVSYIWSHNLDLTDGERGGIACTMSNSQCSNCKSDLESLRCPEWTYEEVTSLIRRQLTQSAIMAAIFMWYDLNVMIHGFNLRKHLSMYQIDYV